MQISERESGPAVLNRRRIRDKMHKLRHILSECQRRALLKDLLVVWDRSQSVDQYELNRRTVWHEICLLQSLICKGVNHITRRHGG